MPWTSLKMRKIQHAFAWQHLCLQVKAARYNICSPPPYFSPRETAKHHLHCRSPLEQDRRNHSVRELPLNKNTHSRVWQLHGAMHVSSNRISTAFRPKYGAYTKTFVLKSNSKVQLGRFLEHGRTLQIRKIDGRSNPNKVAYYLSWMFHSKSCRSTLCPPAARPEAFDCQFWGCLSCRKSCCTNCLLFMCQKMFGASKIETTVGSSNAIPQSQPVPQSEQGNG